MQCSEAKVDDHLDETLAIIVAAVWILPLREESIVLLEDHEQRVQRQPLVQTQGGYHILADARTNYKGIIINNCHFKNCYLNFPLT